MIWAVAAMTLLGAALFRLRGDAIVGSTTAGRLLWSCGMAAGLAVVAFAWWPLILALALFVGCLFPWWGSIDMGRNDGTWLKDAALQAIRGVLWVVPAAVVTTHFAGAWWVVLVGLTAVPFYEIGWRLPLGSWRGSPAGEILFGGAIGATLAVATWGTA